MRVHFVLGPAGSGKTTRCLAEIRAALREPQGPPLLLLAPKQATFQLERQLLSSGELGGFVRLQILSFERLADLVVDNLQTAAVPLLEEEGRVMLLRALLMELQGSLKIFHATARLPGFARQLSLLLRECQCGKISPERLTHLSAKLAADESLSAKLSDLATLLRSYLEQLRHRGLQDATQLLDLASDQLRHSQQQDAAPSGPLPSTSSRLRLGGLWMDGFAQMTAQELDLLGSILPCADHATLAFCLDQRPEESPSWLSTWSVVGETFRRCWHRLSSVKGATLTRELISRHATPGRFAPDSALAHLEREWHRWDPSPFAGSQDPAVFPIRVVRCRDAEAEAVWAAREILRFVRDRGGRYREAAVVVRSLEDYHVPLRRVFARYDIPFFMDRRESIGHHPLAELTRSALRMAAWGWRHEDLFSALKSGLVVADPSWVDRLENAALAQGWNGSDWWQPLRSGDSAGTVPELEAIRSRVVPEFLEFTQALSQGQAAGPSGVQISGALRALWNRLEVAQKLEQWALRFEAQARLSNSAHRTVWEELQRWLDNLELAFGDRGMPLAQWLPILEAGLGSLTVGVIPPALDQVVIGTIDRSRNSELRLCLALGLNESVFPSPPEPPKLLTESDRLELALADVSLGQSTRRQLGHERYYGYIAFTRASEQLGITFAASDAGGTALHPSPFLDRLQRMFPGLNLEDFTGFIPWDQAEHLQELSAPLLRHLSHSIAASDAARIPSGLPAELVEGLIAIPRLGPLLERHQLLTEARSNTKLDILLTEKLYGSVLRSSVSALEDFASCPFKFFVARGLGAKERELFEVDAREQGSFQHGVLETFHQQLTADKLRWRDLTVEEAKVRIRKAGMPLLQQYRQGLFLASPEAKFRGERLIEELQEMVSVLTAWMSSYGFDPVAVEVGFGLDAGGLPGWTLALDPSHSLLLRGRIDRVDLCAQPGDAPALVMVLDYKSSARSLSPAKMEHGLQLQLLSYLGVLKTLSHPEAFFGCQAIEPVGAFYVCLKSSGVVSADREEAAEKWDRTGHKPFQHRGRFNASWLQVLDRSGSSAGQQFAYVKNKDGQLRASSGDPVSAAEFGLLQSQVRDRLIEFGRSIYAGDVAVSPYQLKRERACDHCEFQSVCRFDPWSDSFRVLRSTSA